MSPIGTGIGRPILGRHHANHQEPTQPSYDLLSPRRLFPPDTAPTQEFAWPQRPALQRTSSWQTLSSVSEVPLVSKVLNMDEEIFAYLVILFILQTPDRSTIADVSLSRSNFTPRCGRECE